MHCVSSRAPAARLACVLGDMMTSWMSGISSIKHIGFIAVKDRTKPCDLSCLAAVHARAQ